VLPPARAFAKPTREIGPKVVKLGGKQAHAARERFALPQGFRRSVANRNPADPSLVSPQEHQVQSNPIICGEKLLHALKNLPQIELARQRQALAIDLHPWSFPDTDAALHPESAQDFTGARKRPSVLIQFAQLPTNQAVVPPALPLLRPLGIAATTHSLKRIDSTSITTGGAPLPVAIRNPLARTFSIDLTPIRVHTDLNAQKIARSLSTRAFAYGHNILLGAGEQPTDLRLMAHEVAHVVQQSHGATLQHFTTGPGDACEREAEQASAAALRGDSFTVQQHTSPRPQGLFGIELPNPLNWLANQANNIPGFRMFTIILGVNPINMSPVARSAANIMRAMVEFMPGGGLITQALDNYGIFDRVGGWVEEQIASLGMSVGAIRAAVTEFIDSLSPSDILHLGGVWDRAVRIFSVPIDRIISFASGLVTGIIGFIKDAILQPLAQLASQTRGWDLLTAVLGRNPITGEPVPRNAETLIGGFMKLIGQEEIWNNLKRANAVARAWSWFQGALTGLLGFVSQIPTLFMSALRSLELMDIVLLPRAFVKVGTVFGSFLGQFFSWAGQQVMSLLEIIFEVLAPAAMPYIRRAAGALQTIIQNPVGFIGNLVRAGIQGFRQFASNFLTHLRASLIGWLTGTMSGAAIYIPQAFSLVEILKFVLSVLGLTWQNIRQKLVRATSEGVVRAMETGFDIVVTLVTQGPAAAWQQIQEGISNLREMVMEQVMTFVRDRVVQAAITRLVTSLNPAGAFIQAVIAIYNTIMFFVERLRQIAQVAMSFIDSMAAIASGNIGAAANRVEQTMAGLLTLVISFLARIAGLGRVSDAVINIVNRVRAPIDRALDRVVAWIVAQARRLGRFVAQAGVPADPNQRLQLAARASVAAARRLSGRITAGVLTPVLSGIKIRYGLQVLEPYQQAANWWVRATINPTLTQNLGLPTAAPAAATTGATTIPYNVGDMFKTLYTEGMWVAQVTAKSATHIGYRFLDSRKGTRTVTVEAFGASIASGEVQSYVADRRGMFMGSNPSRQGPVGTAIKARYGSLYNAGPPEQVRWPMSATGAWVNLSECDLSHEPEDAVTFWNREGYKHGPRSAVVRAFMTNPANYVFEPLSSNRSRASRGGETYRDPLVV
jgi:hypothetical protein